MLDKIRRLAQTAACLAEVYARYRMNRSPKCLPVLHLMLTDKCNLRCPMCGACDYRPGDHDMLTTDEWGSVIQSASSLNTQVISLTGGEPFLRPDLFELIRLTHDHGIPVHLNTNGTLLTHANVRDLAECGPETLSVSLDAPEPKLHNSLRAADTFNRIIAGIRRVLAHAPRTSVSINFLITRINYRTMADMVSFAEDLGVHQIKFMPLHSNLLHGSKPLEDYAEFVFRRDDLDQLDAEIAKLEQALRQSRLRSCSNSFLAGIRRSFEVPGAHFRCFAGYASCVVDPRGFVAPCFDKKAIVSIRDQPLQEIWRSSDFQRLRRMVRSCQETCWDTTNTEISLRFNPRVVLGELRHMIHEISFYLRSRAQ